MEITNYEWGKYISSKRLNEYNKKYADLFKIRDAIKEADLKNAEKLVVTLEKKRNYKEVLGIAGGLDYWWVIDFVAESDSKCLLLYRNCKIHGQTDPAKLWSDTLIQLENGFIVNALNLTNDDLIH